MGFYSLMFQLAFQVFTRRKRKLVLYEGSYITSGVSFHLIELFLVMRVLFKQLIKDFRKTPFATHIGLLPTFETGGYVRFG